jgi:hypothetical protein
MAVTSTKFSQNKNSSKKLCQSDEYHRYKDLLPLVLDGEASLDDKVLFENHIKKCVICAENYRLELSLKESIKTKLEFKKVPDGLIDSIKDKIRQNH